MAEPIDDSTLRAFSASSSRTGEGIVVDIGTGDGTFVYQSARENPRKFYIGIDPSPRPLEKISEKIHRKPERGGSPNVLFVQAAVEDLPEELDGVADEVHVHFPWGSLLRAVSAGDAVALRNIRRICAPGALVEIVIGFDPDRDAGELSRLGLLDPGVDAARYADAGFEVVERGVLAAEEWARIDTSWARRLRGNENRTVVYLIARAAPHASTPPLPSPPTPPPSR